jgi:hypothetical protein
MNNAQLAVGGSRMRSALVMVVAGLTLSGCITGYTLVPPGQVSVAQGTMTVRPSRAWNKAPQAAAELPQEEGWTQNGPVLDAVFFYGALPDGQAIVKQRPKDDRKVPVFHSTMTPQDLVSMIESAHRIRGAKLFDTTGVKPVTFVGQQGVQFDYTYVGDDNIKRRGRTIMAVANGKLYMMALQATALHYFDAALPEFETMTASATIR